MRDRTATLVLVFALSANVASATPEQTLARLLASYHQAPKPELLLEIGSAQRELGQLADAANTYARYLVDPATDPARAMEVTAILRRLDPQVGILTIHVAPHHAEISIDGGPFTPVESALITRVPAGPHTVRMHEGAASTEIDLTAFIGEPADVTMGLPGAPVAPPDSSPPVVGWMIDGSRPEFAPIVATADPEPVSDTVEELEPSDEETDDASISSGILAIMRIDGNHWKGFAGGLGFAYTVSDSLELDLTGLKSDVWGIYAGARYRFLTGMLRPYAGAGLPAFFFTDDSGMSQIAFGVRAAGGLEVMINSHLSAVVDLGIEHFFGVADKIYKGSLLDETAFAPTLGLIGRL